MTQRTTVSIRRSLAAAAAVLIALTVGGTAAAAPAQAADSCTVKFHPLTWTVDAQDNSNYVWDADGNLVWTGQPTVGIGFQGFFDVTNNGAPIDSWSVRWRTPRATHLAGAGVFNATYQGSINILTEVLWLAKAPVWSTSLATGQHASFGFQGVLRDPAATWSSIVTRFSLSGNACTILN